MKEKIQALFRSCYLNAFSLLSIIFGVVAFGSGWIFGADEIPALIFAIVAVLKKEDKTLTVVALSFPLMWFFLHGLPSLECDVDVDTNNISRSIDYLADQLSRAMIFKR